MNALDASRAEATQLLAEMSLISEAPAANLNSDPGRDKPATRAPTAPPDYERIYDVWVQRFHDRWDDAIKLSMAVQVAAIELELRRGRKPSLVSTDDTGRPIIGPDGQPVHEDTWESENRIMEWHRGRDAELAAQMESAIGAPCSAEYIKRLRARNCCDRKLGLPQPPPERRRDLAWQIKAEHPNWGARRIARELNVSVSHAQDLLKPVQDQEAA